MAPTTTRDGHEYELLELELQPMDGRDSWVHYAKSMCGSDRDIAAHVNYNRPSNVGSDAGILHVEEPHLSPVLTYNPTTSHDSPNEPPDQQSEESSNSHLLAARPVMSQTTAQPSGLSPCSSIQTPADQIDGSSNDERDEASQMFPKSPVGSQNCGRDAIDDGQLSESNDSHGQPTANPSRERKSRAKSWKVGIATGAVMTTTVLCINVIVLLSASLSFGHKDGIGTAHEGKCKTVSAWSFWLHIFINILSSMLLSASNYAMQCACSPTREECDRAHARGRWLDVGIPSIRNLCRISYQRRIIWASLALSSIPIHLLYNSAVFETLDANSYFAIAVTPEFLGSELGNISSHFDQWYFDIVMPVQNIYLADNRSFVRLAPQECVDTYATYFLSGHADVIVVAENSVGQNESTGFDAGGGSSTRPFDWICGIPGCTSVARAKETGRNWMIKEKRISHCLSRVVESHCKLQFSVYILVAVIVCNLVKNTAMLWMLWRQPAVTFVTFGDALADWLDRPDWSSKDSCLLSRSGASYLLRGTGPEPSPSARSGKRHWQQAVSIKRWVSTTALCAAALAIVGFFFSMAVDVLKEETGASVLDLGFGSADPRLLIDANTPILSNTALARMILIINTPQVILSFVYLSYNALLTSMHLAHEFSGYAIRRKPLRVTTPCGQQRTTYWLSLPYTYALPLIATSAALHWLVSRSIFLVRVEYYDRRQTMRDNMSSMGYSPPPMLAVLVIGTCIMLGTIAMGFRRLQDSSIPVAASCSLALAAATHRPAEDVDASVLPVKWGEIVSMGNEDVGHCCLTSQDVVDVIPGRRYA